MLRTKKIGFIAGLTSRFRLNDKIKWEYRDIIKNENSNIILSESNLIKDSPRIKFYELDILHIGFLYKFKRLKISPIANFGNFTFKDLNGINGNSRLDLFLELSWQM